MASASEALEAAGQEAEQKGLGVSNLGELEGSTKEVAQTIAARVDEIVKTRDSLHQPCVVLSGGEATTRASGAGRGGPNSELVLELARMLDGAPGVWALSADTDGIDGTGPHAGAFLAPDTLERASQLDLSAASALRNSDTYGFFAALEDVFVTGPTLTNVNDFRTVLILP